MRLVPRRRLKRTPIQFLLPLHLFIHGLFIPSVIQQPVPGVLVGLGKGLGDRARIDLSASYAPPEFAFGGNVLGVVSERLDQAVEVAARLNIRF